MTHRIAFVLVLSALASFAQKLPIITCSSSSVTTGHPCGHALDNNAATYWESNAGNNNVLLTLDLGAIRGVKRIVVTWGANAGQLWIRAKNTADDPGMDFPSRSDLEYVTPNTTANISFHWSEVNSARYLEIRGVNVGVLTIKEIAVYGMGVYSGENEILSQSYAIGNHNLYLNGAFNDWAMPPTFSNTMANRLVAISTVVYGNDGIVQNLGRIAGPPFLPGSGEPGQAPGRSNSNYGGKTELREVSPGVWKLHVKIGPYFMNNTNYQGTAVNRGYVTVYYLANDPE
jgi:hypothetical protein